MKLLFIFNFSILMHTFVSPTWIENKDPVGKVLDNYVEFLKDTNDAINCIAGNYYLNSCLKDSLLKEHEFINYFSNIRYTWNVSSNNFNRHFPGENNWGDWYDRDVLDSLYQHPVEAKNSAEKMLKAFVEAGFSEDYAEDSSSGQGSTAASESTLLLDGLNKSVKPKLQHMGFGIIYGFTGKTSETSPGISDAVGCIVLLQEENGRMVMILAMHDSIDHPSNQVKFKLSEEHWIMNKILPYIFGGANWVSNFEWGESDEPLLGGIHKGYGLTMKSCFYSIIEEIYRIYNDLEENDAKMMREKLSIIVTGHSSGGAIGEMVAVVLASLLKDYKSYSESDKEDLEKLIRSHFIIE